MLPLDAVLANPGVAVVDRRRSTARSTVPLARSWLDQRPELAALAGFISIRLERRRSSARL